MVVNPDIAAVVGLGKNPGQILVAFAAETQHALEKRARERWRASAPI
jgi:phosphopantothenoylcysteine decarboxylase/phosphopantothenate--cysteine ligase